MRVGSVEALRHAYPNHFADTTVFVAEVEGDTERSACPESTAPHTGLTSTTPVATASVAEHGNAAGVRSGRDRKSLIDGRRAGSRGDSPVLPRPESADGSPRRPPDKA